MVATTPSSNSRTLWKLRRSSRARTNLTHKLIFLIAISKLVDSNSKLNNFLSAERRKNISLINENASLKIEIIKLKDRNSRAISSYHFATTTENVCNHVNENAATDSLTDKSETKETAKPIEDTNNKDAKAAADMIKPQWDLCLKERRRKYEQHSGNTYLCECKTDLKPQRINGLLT